MSNYSTPFLGYYPTNPLQKQSFSTGPVFDLIRKQHLTLTQWSVQLDFDSQY